MGGGEKWLDRMMEKLVNRENGGAGERDLLMDRMTQSSDMRKLDGW